MSLLDPQIKNKKEEREGKGKISYAPIPLHSHTPRPSLYLTKIQTLFLNGLAYLYVLFCLLIFVMPFGVTFWYSLLTRGRYPKLTLANYQYVFGSFLDSLLLSSRVSLVTLLFNFLIVIPAAYALVRCEFKGKKFVLTLLNVPLYSPAIILGIGLLLIYHFTYGLYNSFWGLCFGMMVGTFPLMLMPVMVALKDLDKVYEEAALCLGASPLYTFFKVTLPLIGPGISAGIILNFVIVWNEFLVTLFIAGPDYITAPLKVYNQILWFGYQNTTAALAATLQIISFLALMVYFKLFGSRFLKGRFF